MSAHGCRERENHEYVECRRGDWVLFTPRERENSRLYVNGSTAVAQQSL